MLRRPAAGVGPVSDSMIGTYTTRSILVDCVGIAEIVDRAIDGFFYTIFVRHYCSRCVIFHQRSTWKYNAMIFNIFYPFTSMRKFQAYVEEFYI